jgi:glycine dehydrogenase
MMNMSEMLSKFGRHRKFSDRHLGSSAGENAEILKVLGVDSIEELANRAVPKGIRIKQPLNLPVAATEQEAVTMLRTLAKKNKVWRSYIGTGYNAAIVPPAIQRNILENPGWYTQYTPYQAEISQGRLEALLNFQTMISDLTGLPVANSSLLDEATAAAEAMMMAYSARKNDETKKYFVANSCHPQVIELVQTRADPFGVSVIVGDAQTFQPSDEYFGALYQYPCTNGSLMDYKTAIKRCKEKDLMVTMSCDILALVLLESPGALGADIAVGNSQRFGVPLGYGGPHAGFMSTTEEHKRRLPGRIVGVSKDKEGRNAIRLALQTREQHIRREKATSNICTAQALLAIMSSMYACYHGSAGLIEIAERVHAGATIFAAGLKAAGFKLVSEQFFDTVTVVVDKTQKANVIKMAQAKEINLRLDLEGALSVSFDETVATLDLQDLLDVFGVKGSLESFASAAQKAIPNNLVRTTKPLSNPVFSRLKSETDLMRYIRGLEGRDLSLTTSMIPLGSCTMKLNAAAELYPISWPEFGSLHPFVPQDQAAGYAEVFKTLEAWLCEITGFDAMSLQPNSGAQGEYAGLLVVRSYLKAKGEGHRKTCLIPQSAHGTNPASAALAGMKIVIVACDESGNIDIVDLQKKAAEHAKDLACFMVTYPSTHGVFEEGIREVCDIIHKNGGQVYMDGANMNAQTGLCRPGDIGADVCHLNLHKTFCIPHGGGGPGMGPIGVAKHLAPFLPGHSIVKTGGAQATSAVSAAPWGSASILPISWMYIRMMGADGLKLATETAILNANYVAKRLDPHFPVLYKGQSGLVAHECIVDVRGFKASTGVEVEDVAKRLMDYGFHAPTVSFPVAGTLMIEPTESESKAELDRFCDAMISIKKEIDRIASGTWDKINNPLKQAPHTQSLVMATSWDRPYSREEAGFPAPWTKERKFWPSVARIDNAFGDRNLVCTCPDMASYSS